MKKHIIHGTAMFLLALGVMAICSVIVMCAVFYAGVPK